MIREITSFSLRFSLKLAFSCFLLWIAVLIMFADALRRDAVDLTRILPLIEGKINQKLDDNYVVIKGMSIKWNGAKNAIELIADSVDVRNEHGTFLYIPQINVSVLPAPLVFGRLSIENMDVSRIILSLMRKTDGQLQITGRTKDDTKSPNKPVPAILTLNDLIYDLPDLKTLNINDAKIIYTDAVENRLQHFDPVTIRIDMNEKQNDRVLSGHVSLPFGEAYLKNVIQLNFQTQAEPLALNIRANVTDVPIDSFLQFVPPMPSGWDFNMILNADIWLQMDNLWNVQSFDVSTQTPRGQIIAEYGGEEKLFEISNLAARVSRTGRNDAVDVSQLSITLGKDTDIKFSGLFDFAQGIKKLEGKLAVSVSRLPQSMLTRYWPNNAQNNVAYEWLGTRMSKGDFKDIALDMVFNRSWVARSDDIKLPPWLKTVNAAYSFDNMNVDYRSPLTPATKINGSGTYDGTVIDIDIDTARIGDLNVKNADLLFTAGDTKGNDGSATMEFPVKGAMASVFDYIALNPINALNKISFDTKTAKGAADLNVAIKFPLQKELPPEAVQVDVTGTLADVTIHNIVKGLTLSGGSFNITTGRKDITLKGKGKLAGMPIDLDFHDYFKIPDDAKNKTKITVKTTANQVVQKQFIGDLANYIDGNIAVGMGYKTDASGNNASVDLTLGLVNAALNVDAIGLTKPIGEALSATMNLNLRNGQIRTIKNVQLNGKTVRLNKGEVNFKMLNNNPIIQSVVLDALQYGENKLSVNAIDKNNNLSITVNGSFLDARPILETKKEDQIKTTKVTTRPSSIIITADEMRTSDSSVLKNAKINIVNNALGQVDKFELDARAGAGHLLVRYNPQTLDENGLSLRVESDNAGDTLRAFGLYKNIYGGTLRVGGKPLEGGSFGDVAGKVRIDDFKVTGTPILVRLLNALSFKEPSNSLDFERLESDFDWRLAGDGNIYRIRNGTTKGASIGLTFDGVVDTGKGTMNVKGTAAPLSELNNFVGKIPLIGDILTGGGGALLAATYSVSGDTKTPKVSVNPLSVLTPGIIRKLLFEGGSTKAPEPVIKKAPRQPGQLN